MNCGIGIEGLVGDDQQATIERAKFLVVVRESTITLRATLHERDPLL
jgi:hypothetical protein